MKNAVTAIEIINGINGDLLRYFVFVSICFFQKYSLRTAPPKRLKRFVQLVDVVNSDLR